MSSTERHLQRFHASYSLSGLILLWHMKELFCYDVSTMAKQNQLIDLSLITMSFELIIYLSRNTTQTANDGKWHHLCLVWTSKGGVFQMYKDGMFVTQGREWSTGRKIPGTLCRSPDLCSFRKGKWFDLIFDSWFDLPRPLD